MCFSQNTNTTLASLPMPLQEAHSHSCQETCNSIQLINFAKKPKWNLGVKELVFLNTAYEAFNMHPKACNCLSLPNLTGRHLGSSREKCWPIDLARHKIINKETLVNHDGHPRSQKGENSRLSHDLFVTDGTSIQWRDKCDCPVRSQSKQPFESTVGLVC